MEGIKPNKVLGQYWDFIKAGHIPYIETAIRCEVGRTEPSRQEPRVHRLQQGAAGVVLSVAKGLRSGAAPLPMIVTPHDVSPLPQ